MKETTIIERKKIKAKNAILITGLPGIGLVGRVVGKYLAEELKGTHFADMYSPHFPHQVFMTKRGGLRLIRNKFFLCKGKKHDVILLTGDIQAMTSTGQYEVAGAVLDYVEKMGVNTVITIGGYGIGKINESRRILAVASNEKVLEKFKKLGVVFGEAKGSIVGAAGLLPAFAKVRGIDGICLMGETHGGYVDVTAAKNIVTLLSKYLGFDIDLTRLEAKAKESEKIVKKIEEEIQTNMIQPFEANKKSISYIR